jgi:hypothetical protein
MTDYGHELEFGYFLIPDGGDPHGVLETARLADRHWAEVLTRVALELGFGTFILIAPPDPDMLRTFIDDVAPDVRERVAVAPAQAEPVAATANQSSQ